MNGLFYDDHHDCSENIVLPPSTIEHSKDTVEKPHAQYDFCYKVPGLAGLLISTSRLSNILPATPHSTPSE
jgi:hypothetical protein